MADQQLDIFRAFTQRWQFYREDAQTILPLFSRLVGI
jgi:hypothetical protein